MVVPASTSMVMLSIVTLNNLVASAIPLSPKGEFLNTHFNETFIVLRILFNVDPNVEVCDPDKSGQAATKVDRTTIAGYIILNKKLKNCPSFLMCLNTPLGDGGTDL